MVAACVLPAANAKATASASGRGDLDIFVVIGVASLGVLNTAAFQEAAMRSSAHRVRHVSPQGGMRCNADQYLPEHAANEYHGAWHRTVIDHACFRNTASWRV